METEFYNFSAKTPNGEKIDLKDFKGKVVLIVNTATQCGLAPQFDELEKLHQKYIDKGLVVLGFPCNQFMNQESETNETVEETCKINHGVTFQLTEKVDVNGKNEHPVFTYLTYKRYAPVYKPEKIEKDILSLLNK